MDIEVETGVSVSSSEINEQHAAAPAQPLADVEAVILAGGLGTRLRSVLPDRPKVMAEVAGRPFLAYQLERLAKTGVVDVVLCVGHLADEVERFASGFEDVRLSQESTPLGTAGALGQARHDKTGTFLVLNGDSFFDVPLDRLLAHHRASGALATIAAARVPDAGRYGSLELDADDRVLRFLEKGGRGPAVINAGVYVLEPPVLDGLPLDRPTSLERDVFPGLAARGELVAMPWDGYFVDIGVPDDLAELDAHPERLVGAIRSVGGSA